MGPQRLRRLRVSAPIAVVVVAVGLVGFVTEDFTEGPHLTVPAAIDISQGKAAAKPGHSDPGPLMKTKTATKTHKAVAGHGASPSTTDPSSRLGAAKSTGSATTTPLVPVTVVATSPVSETAPPPSFVPAGGPSPTTTSPPPAATTTTVDPHGDDGGGGGDDGGNDDGGHHSRTTTTIDTVGPDYPVVTDPGSGVTTTTLDS